MEKYAFSFEFKNGVIIESPEIDPDYLHIVIWVKQIVGPIILKGDLSGVIELKISEEKMKINYINISQIEYVPQMMEALENEDSYAEYES